MALTENMDNLAANGLIDLGNIHLRTGDTCRRTAFRRALDTARRGRVRRIEARALVSLASLCWRTSSRSRRAVRRGAVRHRGTATG